MSDKVVIYSFGFRGFPEVQGGIESHVENLYPILVDMGYEVHCSVRDGYGSIEDGAVWNGVVFHRIRAPRIKGVETFFHSCLSAIYAFRLKPDIVHVHAIGPSLSVPVLRVLGFKVVVTHHGLEYESSKWGWFARRVLKLGEFFAMRLSHQKIVVSSAIAAAMHKKYKVYTHVIHNGVGLHQRPVGLDTLNRFSLGVGRYIILVSRLVPEKRHQDLIDAFTGAGLDGWKLVIVGASDHLDVYSKNIRDYASKDERIVFTGFQTGDALSELYANAGLFVLPSSLEGMPIAILEALSYGLPVLASDIPANLEVGLPPDQYYRMGCVDELTKKIVEICARPTTEVVRESVKNWVSQNFNWHMVARKTHAVYKTIIDRTGTQQTIGQAPTKSSQ